MKLKLIDEDWVDEQIKGMEELQHKPYFDNADGDVLKTLISIKEYLQSPIEVIKKAFEAGRKYGQNEIKLFTGRISDWEDESLDIEEYLKQKGYE